MSSFALAHGRIVILRALERPDTPALGRHTHSTAIGRQRGLQTALAPYAPIPLHTHAHARARDSACMRRLQEELCVWCSMCLDTACVSKATNWWERPIVSIWGIVGLPRTGAYRWYIKKKYR